MVKSIFGSAVRSAKPRQREYSTATGVFSLFKYEVTAELIDYDEPQKFFVVEVRALTWFEAKVELDRELAKRKLRLIEVVRKFEQGTDRSWLHGGADSWTEGNKNKHKPGVIAMRQYDRALYDELRAN